ncbi:putative 3,4-dihydroxy-2-butanone kinase isoform X2 [Cornus florida]|uniref:putative 3,4-dihydroxy-2-butanone kinase isoform X2 n=1 Tax=Cornus florida TaxID=4283 RepID=UPI00289B028B|nr:putative 3,4-dihydroxy-2-butanone kinase isoform X2 [Cornus florida]
MNMDLRGKKLINDPNDVVTEFIEGLVQTFPCLQYLDGFPEVKVVLRADVSNATYDKVAVISGGGSGHEPAYAGFVGEGMLTAAICGDVFASPSVDSILAGIRAVTGPMGCLLIVKNYSGDRLNFGLATEKAKSEGYNVELVIVGDDCAFPPPRVRAGRRGLAGIILVHKVAGAAAASGLSLDDVATVAKHASEMVGTMGVALSGCTLPGQVLSDRLIPGKMELGIGIHGEQGIAVADLTPVDMVISCVLKHILSRDKNYVPITRGSRVVLMINGLGATPIMELMIVAGKAVSRLQLEHELAVDRVYSGSFMTTLDMAGFSVSIMKADQALLQLLDAATKAPYWPINIYGNQPTSEDRDLTEISRRSTRIKNLQKKPSARMFPRTSHSFEAPPRPRQESGDYSSVPCELPASIKASTLPHDKGDGPTCLAPPQTTASLCHSLSNEELSKMESQNGALATPTRSKRSVRATPLRGKRTRRGRK